LIVVQPTTGASTWTSLSTETTAMPLASMPMTLPEISPSKAGADVIVPVAEAR
jgi:hypothetical protein